MSDIDYISFFLPCPYGDRAGSLKVGAHLNTVILHPTSFGRNPLRGLRFFEGNFYIHLKCGRIATKKSYTVFSETLQLKKNSSCPRIYLLFHFHTLSYDKANKKSREVLSGGAFFRASNDVFFLDICAEEHTNVPIAEIANKKEIIKLPDNAQCGDSAHMSAVHVCAAGDESANALLRETATSPRPAQRLSLSAMRLNPPLAMWAPPRLPQFPPYKQRPSSTTCLLFGGACGT